MQEKTLSNQTNSTANIHSSEFGAISYDIFGSPYQKTGSFLADDSLNFGYLGKTYNATTELYDYGFRDYSPEIARFTSVDPIRDGRNWFSYVVNDPVNYVDLWGLCGSDGNHWIDNGDGTFTALEGATLWGLYGADWQEKSGFEGDPITLQVGDTVGKKVPRPTFQYSNSILERKEEVLIPEFSSEDENISEESGDIVVGINLNFVACIGFDVSIGLVFDLDDSTQSGLFLSGGGAAGVSVGLSGFVSYTNGDVEDNNVATLSVGYGSAGVNAGLADNGNWSVGGGIGIGLDAGFNASIQHSVVIPF